MEYVIGVFGFLMVVGVMMMIWGIGESYPPEGPHSDYNNRS